MKQVNKTSSLIVCLQMWGSIFVINAANGILCNEMASYLRAAHWDDALPSVPALPPSSGGAPCLRIRQQGLGRQSPPHAFPGCSGRLLPTALSEQPQAPSEHSGRGPAVSLQIAVRCSGVIRWHCVTSLQVFPRLASPSNPNRLGLATSK